MTETKRRTQTTKQPPEPYEDASHLCFDEPAPHCPNRSDAPYLLGRMIEAQWMEYYDLALEALRDAIKRRIV